MIDQNARQYLQNRQLVNEVVQNLQAIRKEIINTSSVQKKDDEFEKANFLRNIQKVVTEGLDKSYKPILRAFQTLQDKTSILEEISKKLDRNPVVNFPTKLDIGKLPEVKVSNWPSFKLPNIFNIKGEVEVNKLPKLPPIEVSNLQKLEASFNDLNQSLLMIAKGLQIELPKSFNVSNEVKIADWSDLIEGIEELKKGFNILINKETGGNSINGVMPVEITNWMIPQPVTHMSINALHGEATDTAVTVGTTVTPLPGTSLSRRRTLILYNNSSQTVYIGGANVTTAKGFPIPRSSYSPPIDAGANMIIYGIVASSTADVRVLEVSDEDSGR